jgi:hypothetical protein
MAANYQQLAGKGKASVLRGRGWCWRTPCCTMPPVPKTKIARCEDCYFRHNMLCALNLSEPCTTFRPAERGLAPQRQLAFVFRTERTKAAYAFPAPGGREAIESRHAAHGAG